MANLLSKLVRFAMVGIVLCGAAVSLPAGDWNFSASTTTASLYVWRGMRFSPGFVQQTQGSVTYRGFNANLWTNYDYSQEKLNEIDVTLTYSKDLGNLSLSGGWNHFGMFDGVDSDELFVSASLGGLPVTPTVTAYFDVNAGKGAYIMASLSREQTLTPLASLNLTANVGFVINNGYMGFNEQGKEFTNFYNADFTAALPIKIGSILVLEPKIGVCFPLSDDGKYAIKNYSYGTYATTFYGMLTLTVSH